MQIHLSIFTSLSLSLSGGWVMGKHHNFILRIPWEGLKQIGAREGLYVKNEITLEKWGGQTGEDGSSKMQCTE